MIKLYEKKCINYPAHLLYQIVEDIESYPDFLPWCEGARVIESTEGNVKADLLIGFGPFQERYRSDVSFEGKDIHISSRSGPIQTLSCTWNFTELSETSTEVRFSIELALKSKIAQKALTAVFPVAVNKMMEAFAARASQLTIS